MRKQVYVCDFCSKQIEAPRDLYVCRLRDKEPQHLHLDCVIEVKRTLRFLGLTSEILPAGPTTFGVLNIMGMTV